MSEPYRDLQTGVLVNKLGIMSATDLARAEYNITNLRIAELTVTPVAGTFDLDHLKAIHKHLFSDVYEWAGQTRTMNVVKPDPEDPRWVSTFAPAKTIHDVATSIREGLAEWKNLKELNQKDFTTLLATTYVTLNDMHPFPEGNGRSKPCSHNWQMRPTTPWTMPRSDRTSGIGRHREAPHNDRRMIRL